MATELRGWLVIVGSAAVGGGLVASIVHGVRTFSGWETSPSLYYGLALPLILPGGGTLIFINWMGAKLFRTN